MKITMWAKVAAALAAGSALAFLLPGSSAVGQASPPSTAVRLVGTARLADRGAVIFVPVTFTCPAGNQISGMSNVTVTEAVGNNITQGSGQFGNGVTCTGSKQSATATIIATTRPFRTGSAYGQATLTACTPNFMCQFATDARSIRIK